MSKPIPRNSRAACWLMLLCFCFLNSCWLARRRTKAPSLQERRLTARLEHLKKLGDNEDLPSGIFAGYCATGVGGLMAVGRRSRRTYVVITQTNKDPELRTPGYRPLRLKQVDFDQEHMQLPLRLGGRTSRPSDDAVATSYYEGTFADGRKVYLHGWADALRFHVERLEFEGQPSMLGVLSRMESSKAQERRLGYLPRINNMKAGRGRHKLTLIAKRGPKNTPESLWIRLPHISAVGLANQALVDSIVRDIKRESRGKPLYVLDIQRHIASVSSPANILCGHARYPRDIKVALFFPDGTEDLAIRSSRPLSKARNGQSARTQGLIAADVYHTGADQGLDAEKRVFVVAYTGNIAISGPLRSKSAVWADILRPAAEAVFRQALLRILMKAAK